MAGSHFTGPLYVKKSDGTQVVFADADGKLVADITAPTGSIGTAEIADVAVTTAKIAAANVTGAKLSTGVGYFQVAANTNGTTPVNVFGAGGAPIALTVTSVTLVSKDTTAGNIILKQAANTVATIAKGTATAAMVGATTLANTVYAAADVCTVESSSAGDARVLITFTVA